jgi:hypothetical protein
VAVELTVGAGLWALGAPFVVTVLANAPTPIELERSRL